MAFRQSLRSLAPVLLLAAWIPLQPSVALAQGDDADRTALARSLFQEGLELAEQERFADAAERFDRAYRIRQAPAIGFNLARALVPTGRLVRAAELLRSVIRDPDTDAGLRALAEPLLAEVEPRIGRLTIRVGGEPGGAVIALDGEPVDEAALGVAMPTDPGTREVTATRDGETVALATAEVAEGGEAEVGLEVPPPPPPPEPEILAPPVEPVEEEGGLLTRWWFWTAVGLVVAGGVVATLLLTTDPEVQDPLPGNTAPAVLVFP